MSTAISLSLVPLVDSFIDAPDGRAAEAGRAELLRAMAAARPDDRAAAFAHAGQRRQLLPPATFESDARRAERADFAMATLDPALEPQLRTLRGANREAIDGIVGSIMERFIHYQAAHAASTAPAAEPDEALCEMR